MTRFWLFGITALLLGAGAAIAQMPPQPTNSTKLCPITHNCRPEGIGTQGRSVVPPTSQVTGAIQCPPGTYQIQGTNKCRVK
ncbi:MAG TPA: hypothetical protein VNU69_03690 [Rhizomicrobium sp.]|jgi:hypothetical protein|nr:hypothetical protein [Rhizomicrobium sp.]